ncbi:MAG: leucine-rich repeat domain-containing protein [Clostridia bacterium]|nr:leucine-rich repeat domain-containing protein [Clostridia bacterium]
MKNKLLILLIAIFTAVLCALCVSACRGEPGKDGASGVNVEGAFIEDGKLFLVLSSGYYVDCGQVSGTDGIDGIDGLDGVGITDIRYDADGNLVISFANGVVRKVEIAPKTCEHVYGEWEVETLATCTTQGYKSRACTECGYVEHEITPAIGHDWDDYAAEVVIQPSTCTDCGWKIVTCETCGDTRMEKIEAVRHHFTEVLHLDGHDVNYCMDCGMWEPTAGLAIERSGMSGNECTLTGLGSCTDEYIVVPDVYETPYGVMPVTTIAKDVFAGNSKIKSVYFSKNVTKINDSTSGMFAYCTELSEINIHPLNTVYRSDDNCIVDIFNKKVIAGCGASSIPSDGSVTTVGQYAFYGITTITKLIIPEKIVTLEASAFSRCVGLTELNLGGNSSALTTIGTECFFQCTGLERVTVTNVKTIGQSAFDACTNLVEVTLNKGCERILSNAFAACTSLTTVHIASTVSHIFSCAFGACGALSDIYFEGSASGWKDTADGLWNVAPVFYPNLTKTPITDSDIHYGQF